MKRQIKNQNKHFTLHASRFTRKSLSQAFTLVETLAAISILTIAITGPMVIAQKGISSAVYARDQITAFYLAQEGVEYIRNVRDTNRIGGNSWLGDLDSCLAGTPCRIDARIDLNDTTYGANAVVSCGVSVCPPLLFRTDGKIYGYGAGGGTWQNSKFTRTIQIDEFIPDQEALVTVSISWTTNVFSVPRIFTVREHILNW